MSFWFSSLNFAFRRQFISDWLRFPFIGAWVLSTFEEIYLNFLQGKHFEEIIPEEDLPQMMYYQSDWTLDIEWF